VFLLTGEYTVKRYGAGYYQEGEYIPGAQETVKMLGSLQPTSGRDLKLQSEGGRLRQYFKFYSDQPLLTINMRELAKADVVEINGDKYKVMSVIAWEGTDIPHYKSILYREPGNP
jgi:hypothetical protein